MLGRGRYIFKDAPLINSLIIFLLAAKCILDNYCLCIVVISLFHTYSVHFNGAVVQWLSIWTGMHRGFQFDSSVSLLKTPLVRKVMGNHLIKSTSLEKTQSPVSGFCYAQN